MGARLDDLVPELRDAAADLIAACDAAGLQPRLTSTLRSRAEQTRLYNRFLAGQAGFPVAPPGSSAHEYGEAFDLVVSPMEALADVGYTWQSWGGGWNPGDAVHFELPGATERAKRAAANEVPWYVEIAAGLPFGLWPSVVLDWLGIPSAARKNVTPEQQELLRQIVIDAKLK